jgi:colanic acid biosynthesis glycosyl transferase WcaI
MKVLLLNQAFYPDEVATAQYAADLATALVSRGHAVTALSSGRGYDDPSRTFPPRDQWNGVEIVRVRGTGFGKSSKWRRGSDFLSFFLLAALRLPGLGRFDATVVLTTPPLISTLGAVYKTLRGGRLIYWVMDMNPDQAVAAGWLKHSSFLTAVLRKLQRFSIQQSEKVVVLDSFMRQRLLDTGTPAEKITVVPPWSQEDIAYYDPAGRESFRQHHGWTDKFVVMYSGNHSPCHPLETLLNAAKRLRDRDDIVFAFVGGGSEHRSIRERVYRGEFKNVVCLPYQQRERLSASLSAADLHAVTMGNAFVGIVSPSKIYNVIAIDSPVLYIGPERSHVREAFDAIECEHLLYAATHNDVERVVAHVVEAARIVKVDRIRRSYSRFSRDRLIPALVAAITDEILEDAARLEITEDATNTRNSNA